jgi:hypothetical protein
MSEEQPTVIIEEATVDNSPRPFSKAKSVMRELAENEASMQELKALDKKMERRTVIALTAATVGSLLTAAFLGNKK